MKKVLISMMCFFIMSISFAQKKRIKIDGKDRSYIIYIPKTVDTTKIAPLVLNFHGGGMKASEQMFYTQMNASAEKNKYIVVYPKGIKGDWNVGFDMDYDTGTDDVGYVKEVLRKIKRKHKIDTNAIFATGLSRGGFFTYRLAIEMPTVFKAIAPVGAPMPVKVKERHENANKTAILLTQGNADLVISFKGKESAYLSAEETINYWLKHNKNSYRGTIKKINTIEDGTQVILKSYEGKQNISLLIIENGGHTWPGADDFNMGYPLGKTTHDVDMNQVIWDFFIANTKQ